MPLFQEKAALKQLSAAFCWGFRSMWRRRRPSPLLRGSTPQFFFSRAASSMTTHVLINREFDNHIGCRFLPRYNSSLASAAAAAPAQIAPPSSDDEQKPTAAGASLSSLELERLHVVEILNGWCRELNLALDAGEQCRAAATCAAIAHVLCVSGYVLKPPFSETSPSLGVPFIFSFRSEGSQNRGGNVDVG